MKIRLNGREYELEKETTVEGLLKRLEINPKTVAVEVNLQIIKKADYGSYRIKEGDQVEVVSFVGGGCGGQ
ncbi:MAG: sulfur carrier protein ThiS [Nitrospirae bacterium]|nr:MAG: sulfur carrier protein ThiS [Nitrospirota bacterium]